MLAIKTTWGRVSQRHEAEFQQSLAIEMQCKSIVAALQADCSWQGMHLSLRQQQFLVATVVIKLINARQLGFQMLDLAGRAASGCYRTSQPRAATTSSSRLCAWKLVQDQL